jgi:hypothetical protein
VWTIRALASTADIPAPVDISGKANVDLDNLSAAGLAMITQHGGGIIAKNIAANGYIKFENGLIMQWGYYKGASTSITYPITFPTECFIVRCETAGKSPDTVGATYGGRLPSAYTKSGFTVTATPTYGVTWFAIGN